MRRKLYANVVLFLSLTTAATVLGHTGNGSGKECGAGINANAAEKSFLDGSAVSSGNSAIDGRLLASDAEKRVGNESTERRRAIKRVMQLSNQEENQTSVTPLLGQSTTLLPTGFFLLAGGETESGESGGIYVRDPRNGSLIALHAQLTQPRAWHSATLLPNGTVLIFGGTRIHGGIVDTAEVIDPISQQDHVIPISSLSLRSHHTATLLTDGRILFSGGQGSDGELIPTLETWDSQSGGVKHIDVVMIEPRRDHKAMLMPDGNVLFWGGSGRNGSEPTFGEVFDVTRQSMRIETNPGSLQSRAPEVSVEASIPYDGNKDVPITVLIAVRFSKPVLVTSVNTASMTLSSPAGPVNALVVPAEGGMLAFLLPAKPLDGGTTYSMSLSGVEDSIGHQLGETEVSFTTAGAPSSPTAGLGVLPATNGTNSDVAAASLPALQAGPGVTALSGRVLQLSGAPLSHVLMQVEERKTYTDGTGRFLLEDLKPGHHALIIDGAAAQLRNQTFGIYEAGVDIRPDQTNLLHYTIWMTALDMQHAVTIPSPTMQEIVIKTPAIPGLELHIPPNTVIRDLQGRVVTQISITAIPVNKPPFPLPVGVHVPVYFTIQPGGAILEAALGSWPQGARLFYPNTSRSKPGAVFDFWNYDPRDVGWYVYGQGHVNVEGTTIVPDGGVEIYEFTGAMVNTSGLTPPFGGPPPGGSGKDGDPVDLQTGLFVYSKTDLVEADVVPLVLKRTYRQGDNNIRAFGIGCNFSYGMFLWSGDNYEEADLILPDGGRVHFVRTVPGGGPFDFSGTVMQSTSTPTAFYGSTMVWNTSIQGWDLTLKDGTLYHFGENEPLQFVRDRNGNQVTLTWSNGTGGNITQVTSPNGRWIRFTYDASNRIILATDNIGRSVQYGYDALGRLSAVTDPNGGVTTYGYDLNNNMTTVTDARQIVFLTNQYDTNGRVFLQTQADNGAFHFAYTLDQNKNVTQTNVTDPNGNVRQVTFDSAGYILTDTRALGKPEQQSLTYTRQTGSEIITSMSDSLNRLTTFTYDVNGNLVSLTRLSGTSNVVTSSFAYEPNFNQLSAVTDPLGHTITLSYDGKGNLLAMTDPLGNSITLSYDSFGEATRLLTSAGNLTQFQYNSGNLVGMTDPIGRIHQFLYDPIGRVVALIDPFGRYTRYSYDAWDNIVTMTDPIGGTTNLQYDRDNNLANVTDASNHITKYTYNNMDRLATRTDPLQSQESYGYDGNGNLTQFTDRRGKVTTLAYDGLDRKTLAGFGTLPGPTYESTVTYSYDTGDRFTQIIDSSSGTITPVFDGLDRLTSETTPQGSVTYTYDNAGRRQSMTVTGQPAVNYTFDNADRLTKIAQGTSATQFGYDSDNRRTSLTLPNGIVIGYGYDSASQVTGITYQMGSTMLGNLAYSYDLSGMRTAVGGNFARTNLPLPVSLTSYNANNQLTQWGTATLTYDADGNLTSDGVHSYQWDARNRLASIDFGNTASFVYDPLWRRVAKTILGVNTSFLYDVSNIIQEQNGAQVTANLIPGNTDQVFNWTDSSGSMGVLADALGNTVALSDSNGTIQTTYSYEPFGSATVSGASSGNAQQFTGRENDLGNLMYYRGRYYNPNLQRFISEDPFEFAGGDWNLYAYAGNAPTTLSDPTGLWTGLDDGVAIVGGAAGGVIIKYIESKATGKPADLGDYIDAAATGAVTAETTLYAGPIVGGAVGGGLGKVLDQKSKKAKGQRCGYDYVEIAEGAAVGGLAGGLTGGAVKVKGLNSGSGNMVAFTESMETRMREGIVSGVSNKSAAKMITGKVADGVIGKPAVVGAINDVATQTEGGASSGCKE
jgi:RHS repeat-associated protein